KADVLAANLTLADKKRLEIARALATEPRLLLLDEAMSGLTPAEMAAAVELVRRIHAELGLALCVVEHVMEVVMPLSQRVVVLDYGEVIAEGPPAEIARNEQVIKAYLGEHYRGRLARAARFARRRAPGHARRRGGVWRRRARPPGCLAPRAPGRDRGAHRSERRRQDHAPQDDRGAGRPPKRRDSLRGPAHRRSRGARPCAAGRGARPRGAAALQPPDRRREPDPGDLHQRRSRPPAGDARPGLHALPRPPRARPPARRDTLGRRGADAGDRPRAHVTPALSDARRAEPRHHAPPRRRHSGSAGAPAPGRGAGDVPRRAERAGGARARDPRLRAPDRARGARGNQPRPAGKRARAEGVSGDVRGDGQGNVEGDLCNGGERLETNWILYT